MKRIALLAVLVVGVLTVFVSPGRTEPSKAKVLSVTGQVSFRPAGGSEWKPLAKDQFLAQGDEVLTGDQSTLQLGMGRGFGNVIRIQPDAKATLTSLDPVRVDLKAGRVFALVQNLDKSSSFQVVTPTAMASVRGTGWDQDQKRIEVFEDIVHVTGQNGESQDVSEGFGLEIDEDGSLGDTFELSDEDRQEWDDFKSDIPDDTADGFESVDKDSDTFEGFSEVLSDAKEESQQASDQMDSVFKAEGSDDVGGYY